MHGQHFEMFSHGDFPPASTYRGEDLHEFVTQSEQFVQVEELGQVGLEQLLEQDGVVGERLVLPQAGEVRRRDGLAIVERERDVKDALEELLDVGFQLASVRARGEREQLIEESIDR